MLKKFRDNKIIKFFGRFLLFMLVFLITQSLIDVNRPARVSLRKVDSVAILTGSNEVFVRNQETIDKLLKQMKYKFVMPSIFGNEFTNEEYCVLAFYKDNKVVGIFAYNPEKRLLHPGGKPLSSELYDVLDAFILENYKPNNIL